MTIPVLEQHLKPFCGVFREARPAAVVLLVGALAGCSAYQTVTDVFSQPLVQPCPDYRVIADAAKLVRFRDGSGRDLIDVDFEGEIDDVRLECESNIDKKTRAGMMEVDIAVIFKISRGPTNRNRKAPFYYFISVIDRSQKILYREAFKINAGFPGNNTRLTLKAEPVTLEIPITRQRPSRTYRILTGFKLSREELQFNRTRLKGKAR